MWEKWSKYKLTAVSCRSAIAHCLVFPTSVNIDSCRWITYRSRHFDKSSHMASVAYDRILSQLHINYFLQFCNEFIVESIQQVA